MLAKLLDEDILTSKEYIKKFYLAPGTEKKSIKMLIPGEYYDFFEFKAFTIHNFFECLQIKFELDETIKVMKNYLVSNASGILKVIHNNYRLMLTGGRDSRLTLLSMYEVLRNQLKTFTHVKQVWFNCKDDLKIPLKLAKLMEFEHILIKPKKFTSDNIQSVVNHNESLAYEVQPGSTYYYYASGGWQQIKEEFLIDNYYELGRMHLYGKGLIGKSEEITRETLNLAGYNILEEDFDHFINHFNLLKGDFSKLDIFYYIKNYQNVSKQFEYIDFQNTPLIFCNSRHFLNLLLNVPEEYRKNGEFHDLLLENMQRKYSFIFPKCNKYQNKLWNKYIYKIKYTIGKKLIGK